MTLDQSVSCRITMSHRSQSSMLPRPDLSFSSNKSAAGSDMRQGGRIGVMASMQHCTNFWKAPQSVINHSVEAVSAKEQERSVKRHASKRA